MTPSHLTPHGILERWDRQQEGYVRHRELRFDAISRTIIHHCGDSPRVLDLACGPGSLSARIRAAIPSSSVVGVDKDPVLVQIAHEVFADDTQVAVRIADFEDDAWADALDGSTFDAVVSSTALHWLMPGTLADLYRQLPDLMEEDAVFLNGDHFLYDASIEPSLRAIAAIDDERTQREVFAGAQEWSHWWEDVLAQDRYRDARARRDVVWANKESPIPKVSRGFHLESLRSAGFREVGTVWQYFDDYVIAGFRRAHDS